MSDIFKVTTRRKMFRDKKIWFTSNSTLSDYDSKWSNCLYLHFKKSDFPMIESPKIVDCDWSNIKKRFDYSESVLNRLDFHGGITFYEEITYVELGETFVKVGCDYQHYRDDHYQAQDYGEVLLGNTADNLAKEFEELVESLRYDHEAAMYDEADKVNDVKYESKADND